MGRVEAAMRGLFPRRLFPLCIQILAFAAAAAAGPALAQDRQSQGHDLLYEFHIPAGALDASIVRFTRLTHTSVLYESGLLKDRESCAIDGLFSYPSALDAMLADTGIAVRYADDNSFVLVDRVKAAESGAEIRPVREASILLGMLHVDAPTDFSFYSEILAADLQRALSRRSSLRSLSLLVQANLWVDGFGRVQHAVLARSTGDTKQDRRLVEALGEFAVSKPPPEGLPQPVLVSIDIRHL
jgi:hypothetical protein